jgi:hypothetical protein
MKRAILFILIAAGLAFAGNKALAVQSAILPGMGQISAGNGNITDQNTGKGLGIMAGFTLCVHGVISSLSRYESYTQETHDLKQEYENAPFKSEKDEKYEAWQTAYDKADGAKTALIVFSGLTVAVYAYGIVDAFLFTHKKQKSAFKQTVPGPAATRLVFIQKEKRKGLEVRRSF